MKFQKIRELVYSDELLLEKIHTSKNAADMLTKPVTIEKFKHCLDLINISTASLKHLPFMHNLFCLEGRRGEITDWGYGMVYLGHMSIFVIWSYLGLL